MDHTVTLWQYEWMQQGRSAHTIKTYREQLALFQRWLDKPLQSTSQADCMMFLVHRMEQSATRAHHSWRAMSSYFRFVSALDETPNPMAKVKCPKVAEPAVRGVTEEEVKALLGTCQGSDVETIRDRAILHLLACTGLRKSELLGLVLDDVNIEQRCLLVRKSKTGKPRVVPMSTEATMALVKYLRLRSRYRQAEGSDLVWIGVRGPIGISGLHLMLKRRSAAAGVKVTAHMFRRSFAVDWLSGGGSQVSLMSICGWSSTAMPARYTRHAAAKVADAEYRRMFA